MDDPQSRRTFVGSLVSGLAVGLAGCNGGPFGGGATSPEETTPDAGASPTGAAGTDTADTATESEATDATDTAAESEGTDSSTAEYMNGVDPDASVAFEVPSDGAALTSPYVQWKATASGVTIEEAGEVTEGAGHLHVLVDTDPVTPGETIPSDEDHIHYGTGQEDGVLQFEPGDHTLHLQVGDGAHTAMGLVDTVDVTVSDEANLSLDTSVDGSVVEWEVIVENYTIQPAHEGIAANTGHLHAIIDTSQVSLGEEIPTDARHVHFGDGATSGSLDLAEQLGEEYKPGNHTIHFQIGTATHRATGLHTQTTITTE